MTTDTAPAVPDPDAAPQPPAAPERRRLTLDLDVDICVVGAGLAGLTTALEAARMGASVAVLESRHIGWSASGNHLGIIVPGYGVPVDMLAARAGLDAARELWTMSEQGADYMRATASACGVAVSPAGVSCHRK